MKTQRLFITGTDTGVGKTQVACQALNAFTALGRSVGAYKPVCSGAVEREGVIIWEDVERLAEASGRGFPDDRICPQRFHAPLAPPVAAALEGRSVDEALLVEAASWWDGRVDVLIVEGVGGWLSPISQHMTVADLVVQIAAPVLVVAANRLGVINQTLLTIESIRHRQLPIAGVILNDPEPDRESGDSRRTFDFAASNLAEIESRGHVRGLGIVPFENPAPMIRARLKPPVDWKSILPCD